MLAAVQGKPKDVEVALAAGDKLTDVDSSGWTPLMYAASAYGGTNVKLLLTRGAAVNARGPRGETALMFAALDGRADQHLLSAGADVNASTQDGVTALMLAAQCGDAEAIAALLKAGAEVSARDAKGRTAMDYLEAAHCGNRLVEESIGSMIGYGSCNALGKDEFKRAHVTLERAGSRHTRVWSPKQ
jgi:ankyrin repeat protein